MWEYQDRLWFQLNRTFCLRSDFNTWSMVDFCLTWIFFERSTIQSKSAPLPYRAYWLFLLYQCPLPLLKRRLAKRALIQRQRYLVIFKDFRKFFLNLIHSMTDLSSWLKERRGVKIRAPIVHIGESHPYEVVVCLEYIASP